jgi:microcompartment protein CcmK/EutM
MIIGKVIGNVVSTRKYDGLQGYKLLVVKKKYTGEIIVSADAIGAGIGEWVLIATGSSTQSALAKPAPIDALVVGIIDSEPIIEPEA